MPPVAKNRAALQATADVDLNKVRHLLIQVLANNCTHLELKALKLQLDDFRGPQPSMGVFDEDWVMEAAGTIEQDLSDQVIEAGGNFWDYKAVLEMLFNTADENEWTHGEPEELTDEDIEAECKAAGLDKGDEPPRAGQRFLI